MNSINIAHSNLPHSSLSSTTADFFFPNTFFYKSQQDQSRARRAEVRETQGGLDFLSVHHPPSSEPQHDLVSERQHGCGACVERLFLPVTSLLHELEQGSTWSRDFHIQIVIIQIADGLRFDPGNKNDAKVYQQIKVNHLTGCFHFSLCSVMFSTVSLANAVKQLLF